MAERAGGGGRRTATVTVLFCDLVGSTERLTRVGDEVAVEVDVAGGDRQGSACEVAD